MPAAFPLTFASSGSASNLTVTVSWGDGSSSVLTAAAGQIIDNGNGTFTLNTTHTWIEEGTYVVTVQIFDASTGSTTTKEVTVAVADAPLVGSPNTLSGQLGHGLTNVLVGTFTDTNPFGTLSDFTATVTWDDGNGHTHTSAGRIVLVSGTTFEVFADETSVFSQSGIRTVTVFVQDDGGATVTIVSTVNVAASTLLPLYALDGLPVSPLAAGLFASLQDALVVLLGTETVLFADLLTPGATGNVPNDVLNLFQAITTYYQALLVYDQQLP
jgi:hypothetical protein